FRFHPLSTTDIYTLSLHDALPISWTDTNSKFCIPVPFFANLVTWIGNNDVFREQLDLDSQLVSMFQSQEQLVSAGARDFVYINVDRKSTRLNSSHVKISYAVFCLK